jgi:serine protease Do
MWVAAAPKEPQLAQLEHNGFVRYGGGGMRLRAPDDVKLAALYGDSKLFMDMLLRTSIPLKRPVGTDSVKVTSLGKARQEFSYTDAYGRVWQFKVWAIPFDDAYVIVDSLPTPEGSVSHLAAGPSGLKDNLIRSQEFLANFTWVTFEGTLSRWREYLALKGVQPQVFSKFSLIIDPDYKQIQFHSRRYDLSVGSEVVALTADAILSMNFSFFTDGPAVVWDVGGMTIGEGTGRPNFVDIRRFVRPDASLPEGFQNSWSKITAGEFPFNAKATAVNGGMRITMVADSPAIAATSAPSGAAAGVVKVSGKGSENADGASDAGVGPAVGAAPAANAAQAVSTAQAGDIRYVLSIQNESQPGQDAMQAKLDVLNKAFKPLEH